MAENNTHHSLTVLKVRSPKSASLDHRQGYGQGCFPLEEAPGQVCFLDSTVASGCPHSLACSPFLHLKAGSSNPCLICHIIFSHSDSSWIPLTGTCPDYPEGSPHLRALNLTTPASPLLPYKVTFMVPGDRARRSLGSITQPTTIHGIEQRFPIPPMRDGVLLSSPFPWP